MSRRDCGVFTPMDSTTPLSHSTSSKEEEKRSSAKIKTGRSFKKLLFNPASPSCSFFAAAPTWSCTTKPTLQALFSTSCSTSPGCSLVSMGCASFLCCPTGSSVATCGDLLRVVPMGWRMTFCSSVDLSWAVGSYCLASETHPVLLLRWPWWWQGY